MEQLSNNAHTRLRERAFTIWEEAGGDVREGYSLWHKLRPMLSHRDFPALPSTASDMTTARDKARPAKAGHGSKAS
jgi:hypothetical protein